jgi:hypothetical protein
MLDLMMNTFRSLDALGVYTPFMDPAGANILWRLR